jgi:hypothetical protein
MSNFYVVFGHWSLRHNEPVPAGKGELRLHRMPASWTPELHSLLVDFRGSSVPVARVQDGHLFHTAEREPPLSLHNRSGHELPLAAITMSGGTVSITHLLTRVETHVSHFLVPPRPVASCPLAQLQDTIRQAFESNHLFLNNFECYYIKAMPDTELEQKFDIVGEYDYHLLNRQWYAALDEGKISGFRPQLGDEIQHWSYDNDFCRIGPNPERVAGYVSVMHWSRKRKESWDEPVVTFKKKLYREDALERWERNYAEQHVAGTPEQALGTFFELPMEVLPSWRRTRYDMACERLATGNILMVNFEDSRVHEDRTPEGRLQQCEIEYLKTRGGPSEDLIYADLSLLSTAVEAFMRDVGLNCVRTNYSKLTFLMDYTRRHAELGTTWTAGAFA